MCEFYLCISIYGSFSFPLETKDVGRRRVHWWILTRKGKQLSDIVSFIKMRLIGKNILLLTSLNVNSHQCLYFSFQKQYSWIHQQPAGNPTIALESGRQALHRQIHLVSAAVQQTRMVTVDIAEGLEGRLRMGWGQYHKDVLFKD